MSLEPFVHAWRGSVEDTLDLLGDLDDADWSRPTDLPGWDVHDVVAHLAHLEAVLAGLEPDDLPAGAGAAMVASDYTDAGVAARRERPHADLVATLRAALDARLAALDPLPADPSAPAEPTPAAVPWSWETLLRNRVVDVWSHEQDVRRAVGRPGGLDTPAAHVTTHVFAAGMPFVLGKKVGGAPGTAVVWDLTGPVALQVGAVVGDDGRGRAQIADEPTATLRMTSEAFAVLAGGRRPAADVEVDVAGDEDLSARVLAAMALTT